MILSSLTFQNFRNYTKASFTFSPQTTVIVGPNTAGKTSMIDGIYMLSAGKSFLTDKEEELIRSGETFGRIKGIVSEERLTYEKLDVRKGKLDKEDRDLKIENQISNIQSHNLASIVKHPTSNDSTVLEIALASRSELQTAGKRYFVNGVPRRRIDFATHLPVLVFAPMHLAIISGGPNQRRNFLDEVLEQVDREYARSMLIFSKALRQRNALLERTKESGYRNDKQFQYWDEVLITTGTYIHNQRQVFIDFINSQKKDIFSLVAAYDHSIISEERLEKYKQAEMGACVTLVGPHRDEVGIQLRIKNQESRSIRDFASRGQQRLAVLQLKVLQLQYMQQHLDTTPVLLLDDIFSELDQNHIQLVSDLVVGQQTIITTTHEEFIQGRFKLSAKMIELK